MRRIFQPLLFLLARCTRNELIRQIEILKAEVQMVRRRVPKKRILLTDEEKAQLIELGQAIGPALKHLLTIVSYETYRRWRSTIRRQSPLAAGQHLEIYSVICQDVICRPIYTVAIGPALDLRTTFARRLIIARDGLVCPIKQGTHP